MIEIRGHNLSGKEKAETDAYAARCRMGHREICQGTGPTEGTFPACTPRDQWPIQVGLALLSTPEACQV